MPQISSVVREPEIYTLRVCTHVASILRFVGSARVPHAASTCYDFHKIYCDVAQRHLGGSTIGVRVLEGFAPMYIAAPVVIASLCRLLYSRTST